MTVSDVVQFTENHKWCGCFGVITEDKREGDARRYMIGVPMPQQGVAYIFDDGSNIEYIGKDVLVEKRDEERYRSMTMILLLQQLRRLFTVQRPKHGHRPVDSVMYWQPEK